MGTRGDGEMATRGNGDKGRQTERLRYIDTKRGSD